MRSLRDAAHACLPEHRRRGLSFRQRTSYNDTLYQAIQVNRQTGHLATIFTPPDLVDSRIFMQVPPEAEAWARSSALPAPPQDYDVLPLDLPSWPDAAITGPAMFAPVRSEVPILGTAGGENFAYFRLQVGPGLNPQSWYLVGQM